VHEFDLLDYFTMCGYKPLLADHKAWIAKISIKEPLLCPSLSLSLSLSKALNLTSKSLNPKGMPSQLAISCLYWHLGISQVALTWSTRPKFPRGKTVHVFLCGTHRLLDIATTRNMPLHDGLLWSQTVENMSLLTYHDNRKNCHVSRIIHLLDRIKSS
jgi:hypothetical protein